MTTGLLLGTGCAPRRAASSTAPAAVSHPTYQGSALAEVELEPAALADDVIIDEVNRAQVIGDSLIMAGLDQDGSSAIAAVDLNTGRPRWQGSKVTDTVDVPSGASTVVTADGWAVADGAGGLVIEQYYHLPCGDDPCSKSGTGFTSERGLVAFSALDRSLQWSSLILPKLRNTDPEAVKFANQTPRTVVVTSQVIVVNLGGDSQDGIRPQPGIPSRTIGYDPTTGRKLWSRDDMLTQRAVGERLVALRTDQSAAEDGLIALDPRTGKSVARAGDQIALTESVPAGAVIGSDHSGVALAGWTADDRDSDRHLITQAAEDAAAQQGAERLDDKATVSAVADGYLWLSSGDRIHAIDRSGADRSDTVRGRLRLVQDGYLLLDRVRRGAGTALYRWHT